MKHSTRSFIRYPYTSKSVLKNSAALRFLTHFSVSEYQISTQLNGNSDSQVKANTYYDRLLGYFKDSNFSVDLYEINFGELYFYWLDPQTSEVIYANYLRRLRIRLYFCLKYEFSGWKTTFTLKTPSCFTPSISFLQLQFNMGIMQAKCKMSTILEIKTIAHNFLARNKKVKVQK